MFSDATLAPKFRFGEAVSNEPHWRLAAGLGTGLALLVFLSAALGNRNRTWRQDVSIAVIALASGLTFGAAAISLPMDSVVEGDRLRSLGMFALSAAVPLAASFALACGERIASFELALDPSRWRSGHLIALVLAGLLALTMIAAMHVALGLVFDPRYKDFPLAALTGPVAALAVLAFAGARPCPQPGRAETLGAVVLAGCGLFIIANEGIANWQALLFAVLLVALALTLLRQPGAQSSARAA